jgi:HD-GYP domain-containing protein (c-di-GMP phosphodiesterase class II)
MVTMKPEDRALSPAVEGAASAFALALRLRDPGTGTHAWEVGRLAGAMAEALGLASAEVRAIVLAGRLHDLGKIIIPERVLHNSDRLSARQMALLREHTTIGERLLLELEDVDGTMAAIAAMVGAHHERWDGQGYPRGQAGTIIPRGARIIAVADAYSAMTSRRSYQQPRPAPVALERLRQVAGSQLEGELVEIFCALPEAVRTAGAGPIENRPARE